jgi:peptidoglycan/LPS O-acetylase OafA/YrhL
LGSRVLRTAGTLSYSLYIWQQLFLGQGGWSWTVFPLNLLCVLAVAVAGHLLVERPFLRLKSRFSSERDRRLDEEAALVPTILS